MDAWSSLLNHPPSPLTAISDPVCREKGVQLWIKRDDQLQLGADDGFCGNKWRKLKYNLLHAREQGYRRLLTFGGAFSNHIVAAAAAGRLFGFETIGVIRGRPPAGGNASLRYAEACGMRLHYIDRAAYRRKNEPDFQADLQHTFGDAYIVPEGGSNGPALRGCRELGAELAGQIEIPSTWVALACGTGGTLAGLAQGLPPEATVLGFAALKGDFLTGEVQRLLALDPLDNMAAWRILTDYHCGGFAKFTPELIEFINDFKRRHGIALDPIYTGKLLFGLFDRIRQDGFPRGAHIVAVHTGGLQGVRGFNERFGPLIG